MGAIIIISGQVVVGVIMVILFLVILVLDIIVAILATGYWKLMILVLNFMLEIH